MNLFNSTSGGNIPSMPRTPQVPQVPFEFGLSTITDFIGLTEPTTPPVSQQAPTPPTTSSSQHQEYEQSSSSFQPSSTQQQSQRNVGSTYEQQQNEWLFGRQEHLDSFEQQYLRGNQNSTQSRPVSTSPKPENFRYQMSSSSPLKPIPLPAVPPPSTPSFGVMPLPVMSCSFPTAPTNSAPRHPPPPPTLLLPVPTATTSNETLFDPSRPRASPISSGPSGVEMDLVNLRQKLFRDIQNNMKIASEQQSKIQDLQNRANDVEREHARLKRDIAEIKRRNREQEDTLREINSLAKSAMTMSSFSTSSSLRVELSDIEAENEMDPSIRVFALDS